MYRWQVVDRIARERIVAIIRSQSADEAEQAARSVLAGGIGVIEIALTTPDANRAIRSLTAEFRASASDSGTQPAVGAGTAMLGSGQLLGGVVMVGLLAGAAAYPLVAARGAVPGDSGRVGSQVLAQRTAP